MERGVESFRIGRRIVISVQGMTSMIAKAFGFTLLVTALATPAWAIISPVPEIDPGMIPNALVLLVGGVLALKGRRRGS